jgi:DNA-directed RNA polymerase I and III subunit RPAC1
MDVPGAFPGFDDAWDLHAFTQRLRVSIVRKSQWTMELDLVGVDASVANALRRVMISELPTMAIETVYFYNNTSIMHDEVLAHRLGLVPLNVDARYFSFKRDAQNTDRNTLVFNLKVKCAANPNADADIAARKAALGPGAELGASSGSPRSTRPPTCSGPCGPSTRRSCS